VTSRVQTLIWVGLFAAPVAFAFEHLAGWLLSERDCAGQAPRIDFPTAVAVITIVAALTAAAGIAASLTAYRVVRGTDNDAAPPRGREWIMSICGIVVSSLLFVAILLGGSGALLLGHCQGS
jgi:hypothetical protein